MLINHLCFCGRKQQYECKDTHPFYGKLIAGSEVAVKTLTRAIVLQKQMIFHGGLFLELNMENGRIWYVIYDTLISNFFSTFADYVYI